MPNSSAWRRCTKCGCLDKERQSLGNLESPPSSAPVLRSVKNVKRWQQVITDLAGILRMTMITSSCKPQQLCHVGKGSQRAMQMNLVRQTLPCPPTLRSKNNEQWRVTRWIQKSVLFVDGPIVRGSSMYLPIEEQTYGMTVYPHRPDWCSALDNDNL